VATYDPRDVVSTAAFVAALTTGGAGTAAALSGGRVLSRLRIRLSPHAPAANERAHHQQPFVMIASPVNQPPT
jgi:hypothetical protein